VREFRMKAKHFEVLQDTMRPSLIGTSVNTKDHSTLKIETDLANLKAPKSFTASPTYSKLGDPFTKDTKSEMEEAIPANDKEAFRFLVNYLRKGRKDLPEMEREMQEFIIMEELRFRGILEKEKESQERIKKEEVKREEEFRKKLEASEKKVREQSKILLEERKKREQEEKKWKQPKYLFPSKLLEHWEKTPTVKDYRDLRETQPYFKKWLEVGPLPLADIVAHTPNDLSKTRDNYFIKIDEFRWSQLDANGRQAGVGRLIGTVAIFEGEYLLGRANGYGRRIDNEKVETGQWRDHKLVRGRKEYFDGRVEEVDKQ
jgi:hypothetical protein